MSILGKLTNVLSPVSVWFELRLNGKFVGQDAYGNRYFRRKPRGGSKRERRYIVYKHGTEASNIPPEWHGWMHHQTDTVPAADNPYRQPWQKPHQPNMTGTTEPYLPKGHQLRGGKRAKATGDYEAWKP